jgi:uncharacterized protein YjbJ (UPF0337 family)
MFGGSGAVTEGPAQVAGKFIKRWQINMNWDQVAGQWKQMKGSVKEKWGKLTDDDLNQINGQRDQFVGKLQERYGIAREEAQRRADEWLKAHPMEHEATGPHSTSRR